MLRLCWTLALLLVVLSGAAGGEDEGRGGQPRAATGDSTSAHRADTTEDHKTAHSRQKRLAWITHDGRLALPPGTTLVINPSLSLPFVRYPPDGFFSNLTISLPFTIDFNKLGLTDNENPFGVLPPLLARGAGRAAGRALGEWVRRWAAGGRRGRRSAPPTPAPAAPHGGERALLYAALEDTLQGLGLDGRACLLRAICEVHAHPLHNYGLVGEMLKLFFSASKSPYADALDEYVKAEAAGVGGGGECLSYVRDCPKSLFRQRHNLYTPQHEDKDTDTDTDADTRTQDSVSEVFLNNIM